MKKMKYILLFLAFFCFFKSVEADTCEITENSIKTYFAVDYADVPYCNNCSNDSFVAGCSGSKNMCTSGCYPLTVASVLASYGNDVTPEDVSEYLCSNYNSSACSVSYDSISNGTGLENEFNMKMESVGTSLDNIDAALNENKVVLASVRKTSAFANPAGSGHYVAIALKDGNRYYVINTASKSETNRKSGWYTKSQIENYVISNINAGLWTIKPNECSNSASDLGPQDDGDLVWPPIASDDPQYGCSTALVRINSSGEEEFTSLGQFLQDIYFLMRVGAPALVLILSTIDYIKAITSSNADELKKANGRTVKRLIIGILVLLLPFLLDVLFDLFGLYDLSRCNIGG